MCTDRHINTDKLEIVDSNGHATSMDADILMSVHDWDNMKVSLSAESSDRDSTMAGHMHLEVTSENGLVVSVGGNTAEEDYTTSGHFDAQIKDWDDGRIFAGMNEFEDDVGGSMLDTEFSLYWNNDAYGYSAIRKEPIQYDSSMTLQVCDSTYAGSGDNFATCGMEICGGDVITIFREKIGYWWVSSLSLRFQSESGDVDEFLPYDHEFVFRVPEDATCQQYSIVGSCNSYCPYECTQPNAPYYCDPNYGYCTDCGPTQVSYAVGDHAFNPMQMIYDSHMSILKGEDQTFVVEGSHVVKRSDGSSPEWKTTTELAVEGAGSWWGTRSHW